MFWCFVWFYGWLFGSLDRLPGIFIQFFFPRSFSAGFVFFFLNFHFAFLKKKKVKFFHRTRYILFLWLFQWFQIKMSQLCITKWQKTWNTRKYLWMIQFLFHFFLSIAFNVYLVCFRTLHIAYSIWLPNCIVVTAKTTRSNFRIHSLFGFLLVSMYVQR